MFYYASRDARDRVDRGSMDIAVGDTVRSRFRAPWTGVVSALDPSDGCVCVWVTHTRRGVPMRKRQLHRLHCNWLTVVARPGTNQRFP